MPPTSTLGTLLADNQVAPMRRLISSLACAPTTTQASSRPSEPQLGASDSSSPPIKFSSEPSEPETVTPLSPPTGSGAHQHLDDAASARLSSLFDRPELNARSRSLFTRIPIFLLNVCTFFIPEFYASCAAQLPSGPAFVEWSLDGWKLASQFAGIIFVACLALIQLGAGANPILYTLFGLSLVCVHMSFMYAISLTIRLSHLKKATAIGVYTWVPGTHGTTSRSTWTIWIIFSMPFLWAIWGAMFFELALMLFLWTSEPITNPIPQSALTGPFETRILITSMVTIGAINFLAIHVGLSICGIENQRATEGLGSKI